MFTRVTAPIVLRGGNKLFFEQHYSFAFALYDGYCSSCSISSAFPSSFQ
jgi:hypothetical protein